MATVQIDGVNIYYEVMGEGEPLVLIQGYGHYGLQWDVLPGAFVKLGYKVVVVDNRGTGRSDKPDAPITIPMMAGDACRVMDSAGIGRATVFGVSMGGMIAQEFAFAHPDRLKSLILGCTFAGGAHSVQPPPEGLRVLFDFDYLKNMSPEQRSMEVFKFFCTQDFIRDNPGVFRTYHEATMRYPTPTCTFRRQGEAIAAFDTWDRLPSIKAPILVITGTDDQLVPSRNSELLAGRIPGAELKLLPGKKHGFFIEAMDQTLVSVDGFIERKGSL